MECTLTHFQQNLFVLASSSTMRVIPTSSQRSSCGKCAWPGAVIDGLEVIVWAATESNSLHYDWRDPVNGGMTLAVEASQLAWEDIAVRGAGRSNACEPAGSRR